MNTLERPTPQHVNGSLPPLPLIPKPSAAANTAPSPINSLLDDLATPGCQHPEAKVGELRRLLAETGGKMEPAPAGEALTVLTGSTTKLRIVGGVLVASTLGLLVACVLVVATHGVLPGLCESASVGKVLAAWGLSNLAVAIWHEALVRYGAIVFLEVSEELNWHIDYERTGGVGKRSLGHGKRPPIETRITLRNYGRHADLPLVPGTKGSAAYAFFNILVPLAVWVLLFFHF